MLVGGSAALDLLARETMLLACAWFVLGGLDDLFVDLCFVVRRLRGAGPPPPEEEPLGEGAAGVEGPVAIFVPAWDEARVIAPMLRAALARLEGEYRLYVGLYPNDAATVAAAVEVAAGDPRVRLVVGAAPGPTTKADCLNGLWRALRRDEAAGDAPAVAVLLHDAEDVVHPEELGVIAAGLAGYEAVQLPVLPLPHPRSRLVSGHYADEFAEAHGRTLVVRQALGAPLPLAGVGCAIRRDMLGRIAAARGGAPFDAGSLTEDYELGLTIAAMGGRTRFARVPARSGEGLVAVRAYFPATLGAAVRQKARWMTGIALAGWDRTGWGRAGDLGDHWMRMRDRRATLAMPVLAIAYCALIVWGLSFATHAALGSPPVMPDLWVQRLLWANLALLVWRLAVRSAFVARAYGWREARWALPRMIVGNFIALLAARRALVLYLNMLRGDALRWDKTDHQFPDLAEGSRE